MSCGVWPRAGQDHLPQSMAQHQPGSPQHPSPPASCVSVAIPDFPATEAPMARSGSPSPAHFFSFP